MALTASQVVAYTDKLTALGLEIKPVYGASTSSSTAGIGDNTITPGSGSDYGCHLKTNDLLNLILGTSDYTQVVPLAPVANSMIGQLTWQAFLKWNLSVFLNALNALASQQGLSVTVATLNDFAAYYNTGSGGFWNCLFAPDFEPIWNAVFPNVPLSAMNVYSPAIATMGSFTVGGSFSAGTAVNTTLYAGAARSQITASSFAGSSGAVTVTGVNQNAVTGRTWTATVNANGTFALTPTVTGDLITSVTGIAAAGTITASTSLVVNGLIPSGRSNPPT